MCCHLLFASPFTFYPSPPSPGSQEAGLYKLYPGTAVAPDKWEGGGDIWVLSALNPHCWVAEGWPTLSQRPQLLSGSLLLTALSMGSRGPTSSFPVRPGLVTSLAVTSPKIVLQHSLLLSLSSSHLISILSAFQLATFECARMLLIKLCACSYPFHQLAPGVSVSLRTAPL